MSGIFNVGHTCFELEKALKNLVVPVICCPEVSFNISEVSVVSSPV